MSRAASRNLKFKAQSGKFALWLPCKEDVENFNWAWQLSLPQLGWWHPSALSPYHGPWPNGSEFEKRANRVKLKIKTNKTKVLRLTDHRNLPIYINGQNIEGDNLSILLTLLSPISPTVQDLSLLLHLKLETAVTSILTWSWGCYAPMLPKFSLFIILVQKISNDDLSRRTVLLPVDVLIRGQKW